MTPRKTNKNQGEAMIPSTDILFLSDFIGHFFPTFPTGSAEAQRHCERHLNLICNL